MTGLPQVAWFSPMPPDRTGIAAYSAELLPQLRQLGFRIDCYTARTAHDFVWRHKRAPYDLTIYQLGNAPWHDYMWAYLASYPGLVVLHDARLHQARARQLLKQERFDDYRREFWYDHPHAPRDFVEYAVEGLGGSVYYLWRTIALVMHTARAVAVHNGRVADDLRDEFPGVAVSVIRMGVPSMRTNGAEARTVRQRFGIADDAIVFAAFGKITPEKRVVPALRATAALAADGINIHLLFMGDAAGYPMLDAAIAASGIGSRVTVTGQVPDADLPAYLGAADVCLSLRWPTAEETSASWLRCLAAARPTIISDLPHLVDVPTIVARGWRHSHGSTSPVAIAVDVLEEDDALREAMRRLAQDASLRAEISAAGHAYWQKEHGLDLMTGDYAAILRDVAQRPTPTPPDLPFHFTDDYSTHARDIAAQFGVDVDILRRR